MGCFFMKINKTDKIMQIYNNMSANKVNSNKNRFEKDEIKLSERAKDYQFAMIKLKEIPDMRMDKVNKLKDLVQSGNYNVEGKKIVEKMYENINFDERI
ncbi:flagellar biosynthesis anti-sigma factor FlgM [Clostridium sp. Cult3]|nr:flagellar biosynthesis anti-sigma factor FlgM [Clostridium sp. Cult3]